MKIPEINIKKNIANIQPFSQLVANTIVPVSVWAQILFNPQLVTWDVYKSYSNFLKSIWINGKLTTFKHTRSTRKDEERPDDALEREFIKPYIDLIRQQAKTLAYDSSDSDVDSSSDITSSDDSSDYETMRGSAKSMKNKLKLVDLLTRIILGCRLSGQSLYADLISRMITTGDFYFAKMLSFIILENAINGQTITDYTDALKLFSEHMTADVLEYFLKSNWLNLYAIHDDESVPDITNDMFTIVKDTLGSKIPFDDPEYGQMYLRFTLSLLHGGMNSYKFQKMDPFLQVSCALYYFVITGKLQYEGTFAAYSFYTFDYTLIEAMQIASAVIRGNFYEINVDEDHSVYYKKHSRKPKKVYLVSDPAITTVF